MDIYTGGLNTWKLRREKGNAETFLCEREVGDNGIDFGVVGDMA